MFPDRSLIEGFHEGLRELGYVEGKNIRIEWRNSVRDDELAALAAELVGMKPNVIVTATTPAALAAIQATKTIPIVFTAAGDPVSTGLVVSLAAPGRNATGVSILTTELISKRLDLLHQLVPSSRRVVYLVNAANPASRLSIGFLRETAKRLHIEVKTLNVRQPEAVENGLDSAIWKSADAALIGSDLIFVGQAATIAQAVRAANLPAIFPWREYHKHGVLISYGANLKEVLRRGAYYVDKVLKGAKPGDLPVEQVSKYELVINLHVAREMNIKMPQELLLRADEVIR
jgi:putative ABC transport system substrate-binding protein